METTALWQQQACACSVTKSCLTRCDPMDCSPLGFPVHGISQARILEWAAISPSGDLPDPGTEPTFPASQVDSLPLSHQGSPAMSTPNTKLWSLGPFLTLRSQDLEKWPFQFWTQGHRMSLGRGGKDLGRPGEEHVAQRDVHPTTGGWAVSRPSSSHHDPGKGGDAS